MAQGGFFTGTPNFSTNKKTANQPITAAVPVNPVTQTGRDWLLGDFLVGTECPILVLLAHGSCMAKAHVPHLDIV